MLHLSKSSLMPSNRILVACSAGTTQHSVACLISLSSWNNFFRLLQMTK